MQQIAVGRLVTARRDIPHVSVGGQPVHRGALGRVLRVEPDREMCLVRWWVGEPSLTVDLYATFTEIEPQLVERGEL